MKILLHPRLLLVGIYLFSLQICVAQVDFYFTPGLGIAYTKGQLNKLQTSYTSYQSFLDQNFANDPYTADPNWDLNNTVLAYSFQTGISMDNAMFGITYVPQFLRQERRVMRESGYGRQFNWSENRHDILFDIGFGSEYIDIYGSVGVNMNNFKMTSSIVYPNGTLSVTNEFDFNGVFRLFDAGYSLGAGVRVKPIRFIALDLRYVFSSDHFPGEKSSVIQENAALADPSYARTPGTSQYPQDYTQPLSLDNEIVAEFKRSYFMATLHFYYGQNY